MPDFVGGFELYKRLSTAFGKATRADLAVAFWGDRATDALGIRDGTGFRIVCNLMSGGTNPEEIRTLLKRGAEVRQLNYLHAKLGIVGSISFLGSSNMSSNGLFSDNDVGVWQEANIVYGKAHPEIVRMFEEFWQGAYDIKEVDLNIAKKAWDAQERGNAIAAANCGGRSLVDVLRSTPHELDALNVRMVVCDTPTDHELVVLSEAEEKAHEEYGQAFDVYWDCMNADAAKAYLVDFHLVPDRQIEGGTLYRRDTDTFPDLLNDSFNVVHRIPNIEGITFGKTDRAAITRAFHSYVRDGARGKMEDERIYNFLISELAPFLPVPE